MTDRAAGPTRRPARDIWLTARAQAGLGRLCTSFERMHPARPSPQTPSADALEVFDVLDGLPAMQSAQYGRLHPTHQALAEPDVNDRPELIGQIRRLTAELSELKAAMTELQQRRLAEAQAAALGAALRPGPNARAAQLAAAALAWLAQHFGTVSSALYLAGADAAVLHLAAHLGAAPPPPEQLATGQTLTGQAYKTQRPLLAPRLQSVGGSATALIELTPAALLILPLADRGRPLGVLELSFLRQPSPDQQAQLERLAGLVAQHLADQQGQEQMRTLLDQTRADAAQLQEHERAVREQRDLLAATNAEMNRVQQALRQSNERNRQLFRNIPCILFQYLVDPAAREHRFVYASPQTLTLLGYAPEQWCEEMNRHYRRMLHPADRGQFVREVKRAIDRRDHSRIEVRLLTASGAYRWCRFEANTYQDQESHILAYGVIFDVQDECVQREKLEREVARLRESEASLIQRLRGGRAGGPRMV